MILVLTIANTAGAQVAQPPDGRVTFSYDRPTGDVSLAEVRPLLDKGGPANIVVELLAKPTTVVFDEVKKDPALSSLTPSRAAINQLNVVKNQQESLLASMKQANIEATELYRTQRVYNGIAMRVDAAKIKDIASLPGVKAVHRLLTKELDNNYSVPLISAPQAWQTYGNTGQNIKVGIIDSGIDYLHTDFGGPGTGYETLDFTINELGGGFPSVKVVGGWDFVGDAYDANITTGPGSTPIPDPDPMDCNGHGSHVAGTTAGYGTNLDGTTYTGVYDTTTPFASLDIGPGVAPKADLYALRVFGCDGSTNVTDAAIEWAVDPNADGDFSDHLDVINMSLGSSYGSIYDTSAVASDNAALAGVVVVASAGNNADTHYITGSPGAATRVLSVASSVDAGSINTVDQFSITAPAAIAGLKGSVEGSGNSVTLYDTGDITADVAYSNTNANGCAAFPAGYFTGKIAYIDRGTCNFSAKVTNAQNAGALAVIVGNSVSTAPFVMALIPSNNIPAIMTYQAIGTDIKTQLDAAQTVTATLYDTEYRLALRLDDGGNPAIVDTVSTFSSRGPRRVDSFLKPDISAPGDTIYSVSNGTGKYGTSLSGTSMAAPHMTGVMALMVEEHPDWSVEELKALVMNTARNDLYTGQNKTGNIYPPQRVGSGRVDVVFALQNEVVLYNAEDAGAVSVSFGAPEVTAPVTVYKTVSLVNKGASPVTYTPSFVSRSAVPGVTYSLVDMGNAPLTLVRLAPYGSAQFKVKMTADPALMTHVRETTMAAAQGGGASRYYMAEASGLVQLTPSSGPNVLRLPVYAAPRPASTLKASVSVLKMFDPTGTVSIPMSGSSVNTTGISPIPVGEIALNTAFELLSTSVDDNFGTGDAGLEKVLDSADLKYVGAMTDAQLFAGGPANINARVYFAMATHGNWSTLNDTEFDIYIDADQDGDEDYVLFNWNVSRAIGGSNADDTFFTVLVDLATGAPVLEDYVNGAPASAINTVVFNTNVVALPLYTADIGLTAVNSTFDFYVVTFGREVDGVVDVSDWMTYDAGSPGLDTTGGVPGIPVWYGGSDINVMFDKANSESGDVLVLHHHNAGPANRAEVIKVWDHGFYFPVIGN
ncbi:MAG: S8 family serine peptidase [Anaerolineae bacterium]|nr:S8 family serine peptidase [Anaerolineae bacterium]